MTRFFQEVARLAAKDGYTAGVVTGSGKLPIYQDGAPYMEVDEDSLVHLTREADHDQQRDAWRDFAPKVQEARDYVGKMEAAPLLAARGLAPDQYKLLAEFDRHVLAGRDDGPGYGYTFVTWQRSRCGGYVEGGGYFGHSNYAAAKRDFAQRAGFVERCELLEPQERKALYELVQAHRDKAVTREQQDRLEACVRKMVRADPSLEEKVRVLVTEREQPTEVREIPNSIYAIRELVGEVFDENLDSYLPQNQPPAPRLYGVDYTQPDYGDVLHCRHLDHGYAEGPIVTAHFDPKKNRLVSLTDEEIQAHMELLDGPGRLPLAHVLRFDGEKSETIPVEPTLEGIRSLFGGAEVTHRAFGRVCAFYPAGIPVRSPGDRENLQDRTVQVRDVFTGDTMVGVDGIVIAPYDPETGNVYSLTNHDWWMWEHYGRQIEEELHPDEGYRRLWQRGAITPTEEMTPQVELIIADPGQPPRLERFPADLRLDSLFDGHEIDGVDDNVGFTAYFRTGITQEERVVFTGRENVREMEHGLVACLGRLVVAARDRDGKLCCFPPREVEKYMELLGREVEMTPSEIHQHLDEFLVFEVDKPTPQGPFI